MVRYACDCRSCSHREVTALDSIYAIISTDEDEGLKSVETRVLKEAVSTWLPEDIESYDNTEDSVMGSRRHGFLTSFVNSVYLPTSDKAVEYEMAVHNPNEQNYSGNPVYDFASSVEINVAESDDVEA